MQLSELLKAIQPLHVMGAKNVDVNDIQIDSRRIQPGSLFVAVPGTQVDGHTYIPKAIEQGACAIVCQTMPNECVEGVTYVQVADSEGVVGPLAHHFFGDPTEKLDLIGVTGTNGKTTIATTLYHVVV